MSLKQEFDPDFWSVFANTDEFGKTMDFEILEGGLPKRFTTDVVWDEEELLNRLVVSQQGVYLGTVLLFIAKQCFSTEPKPEEVLYTFVKVVRDGVVVREAKIGWRILTATDAESVYQITMDKLMA